MLLYWSDFRVGGELFPRNLVEFDEWFSTEDAREAYVMALRWPEGSEVLGVEAQERGGGLAA